MAITKVSRGLLSTGISDSSDATAITIDSSENVGIGVTPSTIWSTSYDALQIGIGGSISAHSSAGDALKIGSNFVYEGTAPNYYDKYLTPSIYIRLDPTPVILAPIEFSILHNCWRYGSQAAL